MKYLLALVAGALVPLSLAPFGWWPAGIVGAGLWFHLLQRFPGNGGLLGWLFGVGKYAVGASWVYVSIHVYGNAPEALAGALVVLFVAGLSLFSLLNGLVFDRLRTGFIISDALTFSCLFVTFEWLLTWVLTGFPWLYPAYGHLHTPLAGFAPVGGVLLISLALSLSACFLVAAIRSRRRGWPVLLAIVPWIVGAALWEVDWVASGGERRAALVQGNIDQAEKWLPQNRGRIIDTYVGLSAPHWGVDALVWPEAAITLWAHEAQPLLEEFRRRGQDSGTALVLGLPAVERLPHGETVFRNTAIALGNGDGRYIKRRLVPFGEYVPLEDALRGLIEFFDLPMSRAEPGDWRQPLLRLGTDLAAMAICYEIVYPDLVRAQPAVPDVLLTLSNDSWFGTSIGPLQHLQMAQMRALENGRWLLRSTNNGVTAIVDHHGRVTQRLAQFEAGVLVGDYRIMEGVTPYTRFGNLPVLALLALGLGFGVWRRFGVKLRGDHRG